MSTAMHEGARGGEPESRRNCNYKHGGKTKEVITPMREINELIRYLRKRWLV